MRRTATVLTLLVLLTTAGWSQSIPQHPVPGYAYIGSFVTPVNTGETSGATQSKSDIISEITVFRNGSGQVSYIVNSATVRAEGNGIDALTTKQIFDLLARSAVNTGSSLFRPSGTVTVLTDVCTTRSGYGSSTRFASCSPGVYNTSYFESGSMIN